MQELRSVSLTQDAEKLRDSVYSLNSTLRESVMILGDNPSRKPSAIDTVVIRDIGVVGKVIFEAKVQAVRQVSWDARDLNLRALELVAKKVDELKDRDVEKVVELQGLLKAYVESEGVTSLLFLDRAPGSPDYREIVANWSPPSVALLKNVAAASPRRHVSKLGSVPHDSTKDWDWVDDRPAWLDA